MAKDFFVVLFCAVAVVQATDFEGLAKRLKELEEKERRNAEKIHKLETQIKDKDGEIAVLKEQMHYMKDEIDNLKDRSENTKNIKANKEIEKHDDQQKYSTNVSNTETEGKTNTSSNFLSHNITEFKENKISTDENSVNHASKEYGKKSSGNQYGKRFLVDPEAGIAFHAVISGERRDHLGNNQPVLFDRVLVNAGNAYHTSHGLFVAPMAGLYVFSASATAPRGVNSDGALAITKNGEDVAYVYCRGGSDTFDQGSVTIVVELDRDDEVSVDSKHADLSLWAQGFTSFSGFLFVPL